MSAATSTEQTYRLNWRVRCCYSRELTRSDLSDLANDLRVEDDVDAVMDALFRGGQRAEDLLAELADDRWYYDVDDAEPLSLNKVQS